MSMESRNLYVLLLICVKFVAAFRIRYFQEKENTGMYYMDGELLNFRKQQNEEIEYVSRRVRHTGRCSNAHDQRNNCVWLTSKIYKFEFAGVYDAEQDLDDNGDENDRGAIIEDVELAAEMVFINDGNAKIIEEYEARKKIEERADFETQELFSNTDTVRVETYFQVYGGTGIPFLTDGQFLGSLRAGFENDDHSMNSATKRKVIGTSREFTIKQHIEVPACSEYKVNFYVKTVIGQSIDYKIYAKISGELEGVASGLMMTTGQIRHHLENRGSKWVILEDLDEFTVIAYQDAKMKATYGIKTIVHGKGSEIAGCGKRMRRRKRDAF